MYKTEELLDYSYGEIATEGLAYKIMRKAQTNKFSLKRQKNDIRKYYEPRLQGVDMIDDCDDIIEKLTSQSDAVQRKINGDEVKHKELLQEIKNEYDAYKEKFIQKRKELETNGSVASEGLLLEHRVKKSIKNSHKYYQRMIEVINDIDDCDAAIEDVESHLEKINKKMQTAKDKDLPVLNEQKEVYQHYLEIFKKKKAELTN